MSPLSQHMRWSIPVFPGLVPCASTEMGLQSFFPMEPLHLWDGNHGDCPSTAPSPFCCFSPGGKDARRKQGSVPLMSSGPSGREGGTSLPCPELWECGEGLRRILAWPLEKEQGRGEAVIGVPMPGGGLYTSTWGVEQGAGGVWGERCSCGGLRCILGL